MSTRIKSVILLLATLLTGVVLGAFIHARVVDDRLERIAYLRSQAGFMRFMESTIQPTDAAQEEAIQDVLQEAARRLSDVQGTSRDEARRILDSTRGELRSLLTEEQREMLNDRLERQRWERRPRRRPPP